MRKRRRCFHYLIQTKKSKVRKRKECAGTRSFFPRGGENGLHFSGHTGEREGVSSKYEKAIISWEKNEKDEGEKTRNPIKKRNAAVSGKAGKRKSSPRKPGRRKRSTIPECEYERTDAAPRQFPNVNAEQKREGREIRDYSAVEKPRDSPH